MDTITNTNTQCAIMFADIVGSTQLYNKLGDDKAEQLISTRLIKMREITSLHNGRVIKTIGDEIMCQFPTAEQAALAATEIHQEKTTTDNLQALDIRIGLHFGSIIIKNDDIFGDAVNIAARMAAIAKANQTITSENFILLLSKDLQVNTRFFDNARVKGIDTAIKIYQILWEESNVTVFSTSQNTQHLAPTNTSIVLKFNGEERFYSDSDITTPINIGRDESCDLVIDAKFASRSHVNLEYRRGKFVLIDHSTNGTYIKSNNQDNIFIRREELPLIGEGYISLGEIYLKENITNIYFSVFQ